VGDSTHRYSKFKTSLPLSWWIFLLFLLSHQLTQYGLGWKLPLLDNYLDPLLTMPLLLGLIQLERRLFFNQPRLSVIEIAVITVALSVLFEEVFPRWQPDFIRDWWDYLMYGLGSFFFMVGRKVEI
jgi:hypothetical protein